MTTTNNSLKSDMVMHGPLSLIARAKWAPSSAAIQTPIDSPGVKNITRASAGIYSVNLLPGFKAVCAMVRRVDDGTTLYQWEEITTVSNSAVGVRLRNKAFASVAGAPDASDSVDQLEVLVWGRISS